MSKIDELGLQIDDFYTIKEKVEDNLKNIYGQNINLEQNSPDEQFAANFAQMIADQNELIQDVNASFDPDQAVGVVLDQRVKLNGITRKQGAYTRVYVNITFDGATTIKGLDGNNVEDCFQVSDSAGNILVCETTTSGVNGETHSVSFRALEFGALIFNVGSVNTIVTTQSGVASVNNPNAQYFLGSDEESDSELRIRRKLVALNRSSVGEINNIISTIQNIEGVNYVNVLENDGNTIDGFGIPPNGIWIIVDHINDEEVIKNIGTAIYLKRVLGTPMKHDEDSSSSSGEDSNQGYYIVEKPIGDPFIAYWTKPTPQYVDINITAKMLNGDNINGTQIEEIIRNNLSLQVGQILTTNDIENIVLNNIDGILVVDVTISEAGETPVEDYLLPSPDKRFVSNTITVVQG